jgi:hypothetical protein
VLSDLFSFCASTSIDGTDAYDAGDAGDIVTEYKISIKAKKKIEESNDNLMLNLIPGILFHLTASSVK